MITEREAYIESWLGEERAAHIHGWDFSHIQGRYDEEQDLPWSYEDTVRRFLAPESLLLDIDTGGGEFLLSLGHPHGRTAATEFYPPNVQLCRETLTPLGIDFREADSRGVLPFPDRSFDLVINRHGDYRPEEIRRILKPGGLGVLLAPVDYARAETFEDDTITDPAERTRLFGQYDHRRVYGRDYAERLRSAGFEAREIDYAARCTAEERRRYAVAADRLYVVRKPL